MEINKKVSGRPSKTGSHDYFGTFMETVQAPREAARPPEQVKAEHALRPIRILTTLRDGGPMPLAEVQAKVDLGFEEFADTLATFRKAGLVTVKGRPGDERLELTEAGATIAGLPAENPG